MSSSTCNGSGSVGTSQSGAEWHQADENESKVVMMPVSMASQETYYGNIVDYKFVELKTSLDMSKNVFKWKSTPMEERGYACLSNLYEQGYKLLLYAALSGGKFVKLTYDEENPIHLHKHAKFQGIFRKLYPEESGQKWQLKIKSCSLFNQLSYRGHGSFFSKSDMHFERVSERQQILQTINEISQNLGRLISVEMVDFAGQELEVEQFKAWRTKHSTCQLEKTRISVDILYEVPLHVDAERHIYQTVDCPVHANMDSKGLSTQGWKESSCDWRGIVDRFLGTGWKLVEIFPDNADIHAGTLSGLTMTASLTQNFVWVFEKPESRMDDNTAHFEITMVEYWFEVYANGYKGQLAQLDAVWEKTVRDMGYNGWEVVAILETPERKVKGGFIDKLKSWTKSWIFFQRLTPPPAYSKLFG